MSFETYLLAMGLDAVPTEQKMAILILVQQQLLLEDENLSLDKAVITASHIKSATQCSAKVNTAHESSISSGCTQVHRAEADVSSSANIHYTHPQVQQRCGNCGSTGHSSRALDFPAQGQTCRHCQNLDHLQNGVSMLQFKLLYNEIYMLMYPCYYPFN